MAGAGYKLFNTGDVLTAAQVNTYLNEQTVMVFADSAARTTALSGVLAEGMMSYLQDTNAVEVYNGTSWTSVGGGASPLTTKGDVYTFSTVDARLGVGANGTVLTADSAETTGLKWATPAGGGKLLQVVYATSTTTTNVASTTFTDTGLSATITPSSATSKIYVMATQNHRISRLNNSQYANIRLLRDSTVIIDYTGNTDFSVIGAGGSGLSTAFLVYSFPVMYLDTPNTTSAITYKLQGKVETTTNSGFVEFQNDTSDSTMTLLEIGA